MSSDWYNTTFGDDFARAPAEPQEVPPASVRSATPKTKQLHRAALSGARTGTVYTTKLLSKGLHLLITVFQLQLVQRLIFLLLLCGALGGAYLYHQHMQDMKPGGRFNPAASCAELHDAEPTYKSGVYWLSPRGAVLAEQRPFQGYCDMTTDGGGWTLVLAYSRAGSDNRPLDPSHWPTDPLGYSHAFLWDTHDVRVAYAKEARFYCHTAAHPRRLHFKVRDPGILRGVMANKNYVCKVQNWKQNFETLADHTAHLPGEADSCWNGMLRHPFFKGHQYHWNVQYQIDGTDGYRWECDDLSGSDSATLHQIWVR